MIGCLGYSGELLGKLSKVYVLPDSWVRAVPLPMLIRRLRRMVMRTLAGSTERKKRRVDHFTRGRGSASGSESDVASVAVATDEE